jgi:hypothetical protein
MAKRKFSQFITVVSSEATLHITVVYILLILYRQISGINTIVYIFLLYRSKCKDIPKVTAQSPKQKKAHKKSRIKTPYVLYFSCPTLTRLFFLIKRIFIQNNKQFY